MIMTTAAPPWPRRSDQAVTLARTKLHSTARPLGSPWSIRPQILASSALRWMKPSRPWRGVRRMPFSGMGTFGQDLFGRLPVPDPDRCRHPDRFRASRMKTRGRAQLKLMLTQCCEIESTVETASSTITATHRRLWLAVRSLTVFRKPHLTVCWR